MTVVDVPLDTAGVRTLEILADGHADALEALLDWRRKSMLAPRAQRALLETSLRGEGLAEVYDRCGKSPDRFLRYVLEEVCNGRL